MSTSTTGIDIHRAADRGTYRDVCKYVEMGGDVNARDKSQASGGGFILFVECKIGNADSRQFVWCFQCG